MTETMKILLTIIVSIFLFTGFLYCLEIGIEKQEIAECLLWREQAMEYRNYYLTQWQKDQCDPYRIPIEVKWID